MDPVSRRDFWAILYQLVKQGMTVFVTTAYLDEAEHCDRVALMDHGKLIHVASPAEIKKALPEACYEVKGSDNRAIRNLLAMYPGVLSADPSGASVHVFADPVLVSVSAIEQKVAEHGLGPVAVHRIVPSLEDMFIALLRKEERHAA